MVRMDPLSIAAAAVAVITLTNNVFQLCQQFVRGYHDDSKFNIVHTKLLIERQKTIGWANNLRLESSNGLQNAVAPDNLPIVEKLLTQLTKIYDKADRRVRRFGIGQPDGPKPSKSRTVISKLEWISAGYEEMTEMVELMKALNEALLIFAPVLPPYTTFQAAPTLENQDVDESSGTAPSEGRATERMASHSSANVPTTSASHSDTFTKVSHQSVIDKITIKGVFAVCLSAIKVLGSTSLDLMKPAQQTGFRLKLWGISLFEDDLALDFLIDNSPRRLAPLRLCLLHAFVNITVTEEQMFRHLDDELTPNIKRDCRNVQAQLTDLLGNSELISMALERWECILEEDEEEFMMSKGINFIARTVESLFDLLPSIQSLRREHVMILEMSISSARQRVETMTNIKAEEIQPGQLIENNISAVRSLEEQLKKKEAKDPKKSPRIIMASKRVEKERVRMEEWRSAVQTLSGGTTDPAESKEVRKIQLDLAMALNTFSDASDGKSQEKRLPVATSTSTSNKVKSLDVDFPAQSVEQLESLIGKLTTANAYLYNAVPP